MKPDVKKAYIMVWNFRHEVEAYWPTPDPEDSFRFAFCEAAEAMDAKMRQNLIYQRNNVDESSEDKLLDELADLAMMLLTTLGSERRIYRPQHNLKENLDTICRMVADVWIAWELRRVNPMRWVGLVITLVTIIGNYPGMNLEERLQARLDRIRAKHVSATLQVQPNEAVIVN